VKAPPSLRVFLEGGKMSLSDDGSLDMLSVSDVTEKLGVSKGLFYKLVRSGRGPVLTKLGERTLVSKANLTDWLEKSEIRAA
jgi:excisionase family DNA binding protein